MLPQSPIIKVSYRNNTIPDLAPNSLSTLLLDHETIAYHILDINPHNFVRCNIAFMID